MAWAGEAHSDSDSPGKTTINGHGFVAGLFFSCIITVVKRLIIMIFGDQNAVMIDEQIHEVCVDPVIFVFPGVRIFTI
jgi:hypothetical protein